MKRTVAGLLVFGLVALALVTPTAAFAGGEHFWGGFAVGGVTGLVLGSAFAPRHYAPPAVVYEPAPVYVAPPAVYYALGPVYGGPAPAYVPGRWVWNGWQWVWAPAYWRY